MGFLDAVLREVSGASDTHQGVATELLGMISQGGESGGLAGLVNTFKQKGLGDVVTSWISNGKNLPVTAEQIQSVLGSSQVQALANRVGISPQTASALIADILPHLVDKATPTGQIPAAGITATADQ